MSDPKQSRPGPENRRSAPQQFTETRWSKVVLAGAGNSPPSARALEELCQRYWHSIYGFLRREGNSPHDSEDLTQQFFSYFLGKNALASADRSKGRFRNFLLKSLRNFQIDQSRRKDALKRGGGKVIVSLDLADAEERYEQQPDPGLTPEKVYDREWATTLLDLAIQRLRGEFEEAGQPEKFEQLKAFLSNEPEAGEYDLVAEKLAMSRRAVIAAVHRLRQRYGELIRMEVSETITNSQDAEKELLDLFG